LGKQHGAVLGVADELLAVSPCCVVLCAAGTGLNLAVTVVSWWMEWTVARWAQQQPLLRCLLSIRVSGLIYRLFLGLTVDFWWFQRLAEGTS
jgi:hypothetical protein